LLLHQGQIEPGEQGLFTQGKVQEFKLDNGMVVLLKENHDLPLVSFFLCLGSGSAQEGKLAGSGISHFIEHMVFKGTKTRPPGQVFKEIESYGGRINAATSYDYTNYKITVPSEFALEALEVLADMLINPIFAEEELEKERKVVLREIGMNHDDPQRYVSRLLWQCAYSSHPYKYPILGQEDLFTGLTRKDLVEFHRLHYAPSNMVLSVTGDINKEKTINSIKELFRGFKQPPTKEAVTAIAEPKQQQLREKEEKFTSGLTYLLLGFHSVALTDPDLFALDILATLLGEGESSRLYQSICNKKRLAFSIEAMNYTPRDPGLFIIAAFLEQRHRRAALASILKQIEKIKKKGISNQELECAKNKIISDIIFHNQTLAGQAQDLGLNQALTADFRFTEIYLQKINEVEASQVLKVAKEYLTEDNLNIVSLIPQDPVSPNEQPRGSLNGNLNIGIENLNGAGLETAEVKKHTLDNGLTLLIKEKHDLPLVSIKATFKGGLRAETEDMNGISNLLAKMLDKGTKSKNASKIAGLIESKGSRIHSFSGNNSFGLGLDLLSKDLDQILALTADLIINSRFPQRELKREKEKNLAKLKSINDNIFQTAIELLKKSLFQKHPYRFLNLGSELSLKKIRRSDLTDFYQRFCVGENMVLAVFGDVDPQQVLVKVKTLFAQLPAGRKALISPVAEPEAMSVKTSTEQLLKEQSLICIGFPGTTVFNQDRYAIEMICRILSQPSGRLFSQIRESSGLAYTLGAYSVVGLDPGYIVIYVATSGENVETVKSQIWQQLELLKKVPLDQQQLSQAKRVLLADELISRQTNAYLCMQSALDELYGLGHNYHLNYPEQIDKLSAQDITRSANQYFDLGNYAIVVVNPGNS
ncbi:MAG: insulinase family protein, partial [Candidatus Omnitrophica bacterium]|nr:insulinase family protein [Candidatus Omnitrophota bacterium]